MVTLFLFGLGCLFFVIGHSRLLYFKGKESPSLPIVHVVFPWPTRKKSVSVLFLGLSVVSFLLMLSLPSDFHYQLLLSALEIFFGLAILPCIVYALFLSRRIHRGVEGVFYTHSDLIQREWPRPLFAVTFLLFLFFLKHF